MRKVGSSSFVVVAGALMLSCGAGQVGREPVQPPHGSPGTVTPEVAVSFDRASSDLVAHDRAGDWNDTRCRSVAGSFEQVAEASGPQRAVALYDAGLAYQRCGLHEPARRRFEQAVRADAGFHRAAVQIVLYDYQQDGKLDRAITELARIIQAARFQTVEGLVTLAALQMQRATGTDLEQAHQNLQRALAINDGYMPAYNQLAILYLQRARAAATEPGQMVVSGSSRPRASQEQLDLAALVAAQAIRKNPGYAPIHNTAGLVQVELGDFSSAVRSFATARKLDPRLVEAHLNYAAVNLSFRGFAEAERAYRDVLALVPESYEAHLGLALALRGQIGAEPRPELIAQAQHHLDEARRIAPDRPEAYYNEAILTQEFKAKSAEEEARPMLLRAQALYGEFIARAGDRPQFAEAVQCARARSEDIRQILVFMDGS
jgi:tetratricopeptide (TPR) repeat protein